MEVDSKMETGWNNGLSGGDVAAVVLYFILVLGIGLLEELEVCCGNVLTN